MTSFYACNVISLLHCCAFARRLSIRPTAVGFIYKRSRNLLKSPIATVGDFIDNHGFIDNCGLIDNSSCSFSKLQWVLVVTAIAGGEKRYHLIVKHIRVYS